jgi:pimeloyl-ACP methyl ester carboxylesterase
VPRRRTVALAAGAAGVLLGAAAVAPKVAAWRLRRLPDDPDAVLEPVVDRVETVKTHDGGTLHVVCNAPRRRGPGMARPIVMSHGVTLSVRTWTKQLSALPDAGYEAIAFDHRGHGRSVLGEGGHSVDNLATDVKSVLEGLDLHGAVLVGHSMGGIAVEAFASQHAEVMEERVAGVVLLSTLCRAPFGSQATRFKSLIERVTDRAPDSTPFWRARDVGFLLARIGFGRSPRPSHVELVRQMMLECPPETRLEAPRALIGCDLLGGLDAIAVPTLIVAGSHDLITPVFHARQMAGAIRGSRLEILEGGGHMLMLEQADAVNRLLVDFARSLDP